MTNSLSKRLLCGAAMATMLAAAGAASAEEQPIRFEIPAQPLTAALNQFGIQSGSAVLFKADVTGAKVSRPLSGSAEPELALAAMLDGTGLSYRREGDAFVIVQGGSADPQAESAAWDGATVEALIVTAQKREEDIQDVPIAISAFTQEALDQQKIEGGFDLLKAIPNVTFSKTNFTSYNFSIRGVGTKAISATTDPGVAVSFNNVTILQNRLFEQEYYDLERVEVLRGPQGTLYGRNATSGVINVISAKPDLNDFDGWVKGEVGNYHTKRLSAMINVPVIDDKLAIRLAGALTDRQGYDYNLVTRNEINGRDLWSARLTVGFEPTENLRGNLIWERFNEDDNRSRTGKQLCHRDPGPTHIGNTDVRPGGTITGPEIRQALFGQGCKPGSLYDDAAFGTPNGLSYNFMLALVTFRENATQLGLLADGTSVTIVDGRDPYSTRVTDPAVCAPNPAPCFVPNQQSRNLREIESFRDPIYRANADLFQINWEYDITPSLTFYSQTAYVDDQTYSFQDYNRFNTEPIFTDTSQIRVNLNGDYTDLAPGGIFCDPQLGCSDTIAGFDIAQADAEQFSQEFRLQSDFDGPLNFSLGANYTRFKTLVDYYVMFNVLTAMAWIGPFNLPGNIDPYDANRPFDPNICHANKYVSFEFIATPADDPDAVCPYVDPNPVESINGQGHNYFRSKNPYKAKSWAGFGELYWNVTEAVKLTAGLRYTDDEKTFIPVPTQVLLSPSIVGGGTTSIGYPEDPPIVQNWGEWTGRVGVDWKPDLAFTDDTLLYAFYSHGYKGGGANPPQPGFATKEEILAIAERQGVADFFDFLPFPLPILELTAVEYGSTFEPEFVDAFEVGAKNTLLDGAMRFNVTGFYYDYKDYQVSQIRDRTAVNENFDAEVWGVEFETLFTPSRNLQVVANLGYLDTRIADGEKSIDIMNRTQSNPNYVLAKPWVQLPSNCVVPLPVAEDWAANNANLANYWNLCGGLGGLIDGFFGGPIHDPTLNKDYNVLDYPEINGGAGLHADLGGNELPNAPHWTMNIGAQYGIDFLEDWKVTLRGDAYWQSQSWARIYNSDPYDKLHGWYNVNLSVWFERPDDGLKIELYAKNILDKTPITDAFLNSDDTGLTTNVFVLDPRLIGLSIRKEF